MRWLRFGAGTVALLVCAGFAIGVRQAVSSSKVSALVASGHRLTPSQQRSAASELSAAAFGYPGQETDILAASVALREHRYARAMSLARSITRAEPDNLQGWLVLAAAGLLSGDQRAALQARQEEIRLDPIDARTQ
jgi:cytochrome c-type biogenesis protein CcmH/NrfG